MTKNSNGQAGDGSNVHPRRDDDSAIVPPGSVPGITIAQSGRVVDAWPKVPEARKAPT